MYKKTNKQNKKKKTISSESVLSVLETILKSSSGNESHQVALTVVRLSYKLRNPHLTLYWTPL